MKTFAAVVELQKAIWGPTAPIVPIPQLVAAVHTGGTVLVAYDDGRPVGFCYGFVGIDVDPSAQALTGRKSGAARVDPLLWSHMLGVLPSHRGRGLGRRLKVAQGEVARRHGLSRVLWTFDPLEARNARLNLHSLGAIAARYSVDRYGPMDDDLNAGLTTDRLIADWWIAPRGTNRPPEPAGPDLLINPQAPSGEIARDADIRGHIGTLSISVPSGDWRLDPQLARQWRHNVREAFIAALAAGFVAVDIEVAPTSARYRLSHPG